MLRCVFLLRKHTKTKENQARATRTTTTHQLENATKTLGGVLFSGCFWQVAWILNVCCVVLCLLCFFFVEGVAAFWLFFIISFGFECVVCCVVPLCCFAEWGCCFLVVSTLCWGGCCFLFVFTLSALTPNLNQLIESTGRSGREWSCFAMTHFHV